MKPRELVDLAQILESEWPGLKVTRLEGDYQPDESLLFVTFTVAGVLEDMLRHRIVIQADLDRLPACGTSSDGWFKIHRGKSRVRVNVAWNDRTLEDLEGEPTPAIAGVLRVRDLMALALGAHIWSPPQEA